MKNESDINVYKIYLLVYICWCYLLLKCMTIAIINLWEWEKNQLSVNYLIFNIHKTLVSKLKIKFLISN
jgi:predicted phage-related endonuclease